MRYKNTFTIVVSCLLWLSPGAAETNDLAYQNLAQINQQLASGTLSSRDLIVALSARVEALDNSGPSLNAIIEVNPEALQIADALDKERQEKGPRGPLHGIPIVLKANIDTADAMYTSAGSLALAEHRAADDARLVADLRQAGAIIFAKANLSEWANFRSTRSVSGWSSVGGQTRNPHVLDRNPCGSSSGSAVAVAAGLTPLSIGTETDGSVVCPASINGIVGIKPTLGLVSRDGIIPIAHTQDTAGPMARSVRDAAILLSAMAVKDIHDDAAVEHPGPQDYLENLVPEALQGKRIGVWRGYQGASKTPRVKAVFDAAIGKLQDAGAVVIDPVELVIVESSYDAELEVLAFEFKHGLNRYLGASGVPKDRDSLADIIAFNRLHADAVMPWFDQEIMEIAVAKEGLESADYLDARMASHEQMKKTMSAVFEEYQLDALIAPSNGPAWPIDYVAGDRFSVGSSSLAAVSGWPSITLPAGSLHGLPLGISFVGKPWSEAQLLGMAYALERRLPPAARPAFRPSLEASD